MSAITASSRHLRRLTDDCGVLEHALGVLPRRKEGYTTDDNARALWACIEWITRTPYKEKKADWEELADTYLSFLLWAQNADGSFHNNIGYDRRPEPETPSDDCFGRTFWAAACAWTKLKDDKRRLAAESILTAAAGHIDTLSFPRGWAYALAACSLLLLNPDKKPVLEDGETFFRRLQLKDRAESLERKLLYCYAVSSKPGWHWFEPLITYGNGVLPWALFMAYRVSGRSETLNTARESFDFLADKMTAATGWIRPIGNEHWASERHTSLWDQQPLEVMKLGLAAREALLVDGRAGDTDIVIRCRKWFHGENDCRAPLADPADGSCCDGLTPKGPNRNRGAESTIAYLLMEAIYAESMELLGHTCAKEAVR